ncbi:MAG: hypothetical protein KKC26_04605, partial [Nanoarchaeota archaeon]|nr:hypothetical protein [Nanoarchaeota archaeon]
LYEIKNEQILFLNSSSSFSYTKNLTYIKKICNEIYSIKLNNCDCKEYDVNNANNLISSYECNLNDKVNIDELKTKSILLESLKNEIPNWKIELDEDENCFHNKVETFNREKICFKNNDIIYYSIDKSELGFISFKEWKFN